MAHVTTRKGPFAVATSSPLQRRMPRMRATCARSARPHRLTPSRNVLVAALSLPEDGWGLLPLS